MNWSEITSKIQHINPQRSLLIGVHPSYGHQMVDKLTWEGYCDGFNEIWLNHQGPRILIPANRHHDYYLAPEPDYEITTFPSGISSVRLGLILLIGSTARSHTLMPKGCIDHVFSGLKEGNYADMIRIEANGTLFI